MTAALAVVALLGHPSVVPWPVGVGPRYLPLPAPSAVRAGEPVGALRCSSAAVVARAHVEIFADRRVVILPAGIGVAAPLGQSGATVTPHGCSYPLRTVAPTGVVELQRARGLRLGDLFRVWGQTLAARQIGSFRSVAAVRAYVDGRRVRGPIAAIPLTPRAEIVLEIGGYVAPHPFFLFAGGHP